jgi:hypothetical protein
MLLAPSISGLFKWRQFEPEVILLAIGGYLRFSRSYREFEELLAVVVPTQPPRRAWSVGRRCHRLALGPALRPGSRNRALLYTATFATSEAP